MTTATTARPSILSPSVIALIIATGLVFAFALTVPVRDSLAYWTAGHQLFHRANPYDVDAVARLEAAVGFHGPKGSLAMLNPPPALPLALPLGLVGPRAGQLIWTLALFACMVVSVRMIRVIHRDPPNHIHILGYCFGPAIACVFAGQIPLFALLGLALFLRLHRSQPFWAGASLWLCMVKPHLFVPFSLALLLWIFLTKRYQILYGAAIALIAASALVFALDTSAWTHYFQMIRFDSATIAKEFIPCLSVVLRRSIHPQAIWLQSVPEALGCIWGVYYFWKHRGHWDWLEHGSLLMLVSVLVAPYTWLIDQSILMPAVLHGAYRNRSRAAIILTGLASGFIILQICLGADVHSRWNLWPAPFWLIWYLWAMRSSRKIALTS